MLRLRISIYQVKVSRKLEEAIAARAHVLLLSPTGPVSLGVAENSLMHSDLQQLFEKTLKLEQSDLTYGTSLKGSTRLFAAFCKLFADKFDPVYPVRPEQMVTGAGVGSLMDQLIALVCDEGDGVLLAAPYYSGTPTLLMSPRSILINSSKALIKILAAETKFPSCRWTCQHTRILEAQTL